MAHAITEESVEHCQLIGDHGLKLIEEIYAGKKSKNIAVNILTHCNAGWLACIDYGTATAPIYAAHDKGIPVHVWVDETRPRNQGARITAFELKEHGVPHTVIADNTGGHLMQHGLVDMVIVGTDRTTRTGDVANKIGTYLKALAAKDNGIPFYIGAPSSSIDWELKDGLKEIPIEKRDENEVKKIWGLNKNGQQENVLLTPAESPAANYAFDVTPARLVTGLITERGVCDASEEGLLELFPKKKLRNYNLTG
jgi:methylthioribose-1-phosphate isomerase